MLRRMGELAHSGRILVVDDEPSHRDSLRRIFDRAGYSVDVAEDGASALAMLRLKNYDVLLTDLVMPRMDGRELLKASRTLKPQLDVVLMTAYGTVENAVSAMRDGAFDFIVKPVKRNEVLSCVARARERQSLVVENRASQEDLARARGAPGLIGLSPAVERLVATIQQVAPSSAAVLLVGETGTGKEACARAIHVLSPRADKPFVALSSSALNEGALELELFGDQAPLPDRRTGRLERAHLGTFFIDEVADLPLSIQVKLARALEEGTLERADGAHRPIDVRVIAATDVDLTTRVREGRFREDLLYRLDVIRISLPPLRERREDIPILAGHFLSRFAEKHQKQALSIEQGALDALVAWSWPGNVRELENAIERAVVLCQSSAIRTDDLPETIRAASGQALLGGDTITFRVGSSMEQLEKAAIHATLRHTGGDKRLTAKLLGISLRTLYRRLDEQEEGALSDEEG
jgi:two-component system response regulator HydG